MSPKNKKIYITKVNSLFNGQKDRDYEMTELYGIDYPRIAQFENKNVGFFFLSPLGYDNTVELKKLKIYDTNKGYGTKLLYLLCDKADKYQITLWVWPLSEEIKEAISLDKLKSWYNKFGFYQSDGAFMIRKPN